MQVRCGKCGNIITVRKDMIEGLQWCPYCGEPTVFNQGLSEEEYRKCPYCDGTGKLDKGFFSTATCPYCKGSGKI